MAGSAGGRPPEVPLDAYDGKPIRYRRLADGVVVYSVGADGKDDGGKAGADLGYRLWDVDRRRQPPGQAKK